MQLSYISNVCDLHNRLLCTTRKFFGSIQQMQGFGKLFDGACQIHILFWMTMSESTGSFRDAVKGGLSVPPNAKFKFYRASVGGV